MPSSLCKPSVMLCVWSGVVALLVARNASAERPLVLTLPALRPSYAHHAALSCANQRCLTLRVAPKWRAASSLVNPRTLVPGLVAGLAAAGSGYVRRPLLAPTAPALGVGAHIALRAGRELDLQLTPTPARCAPLVSLRY